MDDRRLHKNSHSEIKIISIGLPWKFWFKAYHRDTWPRQYYDRLNVNYHKKKLGEANQFWIGICDTIKNQKPIASYVPTDQWKMLIRLKNDKQIHITKTDEGNSTVIRNSSD